jgi:hypothetical protein
MTKTRIEQINQLRRTSRSSQRRQVIRANQIHRVGQLLKFSVIQEQNVIPERLTESSEVIYHVGQRKYNIDARCPWWQRWFFRCAYLPFNRFAFKCFQIPAMDEVEINGKRLTFCWYEDQGVFDDEHQAENACQGEFWRVKPLLKNRIYPAGTAQHISHRYPRDRYAKRTFALIVKDRKEDEKERSTLAECLRELNHTLDRTQVLDR